MIRNVILRSQQATKNLHLLENFNADPSSIGRQTRLLTG
jgi:hypothetical protein